MFRIDSHCKSYEKVSLLESTITNKKEKKREKGIFF